MKEYTKVFDIRVVALAPTDTDPAGFLATNDELGLVVEADTLDALVIKIDQVAMDLFELNVRPYLAELADHAVRPAFDIRHLLGGQSLGELLPGLDRAASA